MKTIGKSLNGNVIIELSNEDLEIITMSLNSYSLQMDNLGYIHYAEKVNNIFYEILKLNNKQEK